MSVFFANNENNTKMKRKSEINAVKKTKGQRDPPCSPTDRRGLPKATSMRSPPVSLTDKEALHQTRSQRMVQKNFFSRKGFSDAGTGMMRGSSRTWASQ